MTPPKPIRASIRNKNKTTTVAYGIPQPDGTLVLTTPVLHRDLATPIPASEWFASRQAETDEDDDTESET